jgi:hypothetical protein
MIFWFNTDVGNVRTQWAHGKRHHIHGAAFHAAVKQGFFPILAALQQGAHLGGGHPVVGGAGVLFFLAADVGAVFHAGHVAGVGAGQEAVGAFGGVELFESSSIDQLLAQALVFFVRAIAPVNGVGLGQGRHVGDPCDQLGIFDIAGGIEIQSLHDG